MNGSDNKTARPRPLPVAVAVAVAVLNPPVLNPPVILEVCPYPIQSGAAGVHDSPGWSITPAPPPPVVEGVGDADLV